MVKETNYLDYVVWQRERQRVMKYVKYFLKYRFGLDRKMKKKTTKILNRKVQRVRKNSLPYFIKQKQLFFEITNQRLDLYILSCL